MKQCLVAKLCHGLRGKASEFYEASNDFTVCRACDTTAALIPGLHNIMWFCQISLLHCILHIWLCPNFGGEVYKK